VLDSGIERLKHDYCHIHSYLSFAHLSSMEGKPHTNKRYHSDRSVTFVYSVIRAILVNFSVWDKNGRGSIKDTVV